MWEAVERILTIYNAYLMQVDGVYKVVNFQEYNSYKHVYNNSLVKQSRDAENLNLTISAFDREGTGDLRIKEPITELNIYVRDRVLGTELLVNGEFDSGTSNWTNSGFETFSASGGVMTFGQTDNDQGNRITSDAFSIGSIAEGDYLQIEVKFKFNSWSHTSNPYPPAFYVGLIDPDGLITPIHNYATDPFTEWIVITNGFNLSKTGNYQVFFAMNNDDGYGSTYDIDDAEWCPGNQRKRQRRPKDLPSALTP
jgi:hypothetical protein